MNASLFETVNLLSGQQAPFTGEWQSIANGRNVLFSTYSSGSGSITLQYKNPFFNNDEGIPFYTFSGLQTGYSAPAFSTSPMNEVRAISAGSGQFWTAVTIQN